LCRFVVDRNSYQGPSPTLNATPILTLQNQLCTPNLSWDFLALAEPDRWDEYFAAGDLPRAEGADFSVGYRRYGLSAHDFRKVPVDVWIELWTERALDPRDDKLLRAVDRTYLRPAATQEAAAAALGLPFSTYRRHLTQGMTRIVSVLWDQEVYGQDRAEVSTS